MSEYGVEWREKDGDVLPPDDFDTDIDEPYSHERLLRQNNIPSISESRWAAQRLAEVEPQHSVRFDELVAEIEAGISQDRSRVQWGKHRVSVGEFFAVVVGKALHLKQITTDEYRELEARYLHTAPQSQPVLNTYPEVQVKKEGCDCECQICDRGGGQHCHNERTGCYI